jgi:hypothetical protein
VYAQVGVLGPWVGCGWVFLYEEVRGLRIRMRS